MHHHLKTPNSIIHIIRTKEIYEHKSPFTYTNENSWIFQNCPFKSYLCPPMLIDIKLQYT
jgi:hypothetical protein